MDEDSNYFGASDDTEPVKECKDMDANNPTPDTKEDFTSDKKITISIGECGSLHVWDPDDVIRMQRDCHVMGNTVGCFARTPLQDIFTSLPARLTPPEAAYLRDIKAARFVKETEIVELPTADQQEEFRVHRQRQYEEQVRLFEEKRVVQIDSKREEIFTGKLIKMQADAKSKEISLPTDKDLLWNMMRDELLSRPIAREGHAKLELPFRSWRIEMNLLETLECEFSYPQTHEEKIYYAAYLQLMKAGFWVTSGIKYGGDLLLYEGDVHINHSICIVKIVEDSKEISLEEILRLGRVATSCHKAILWVSVDKHYDVEFTCSKWALMK